MSAVLLFSNMLIHSSCFDVKSVLLTASSFLSPEVTSPGRELGMSWLIVSNDIPSHLDGFVM